MVSIKKPAVATATTLAVRRVVTCFIVTNPSNRVAIFHRCDTMPSFPSHWAGISGTIELIEQNDRNSEQYETPYQAARRELSEETNLLSELENVVVEEQGGLYLDVPYMAPSRKGTQQKQRRIIRVYPFTVHLSDDDAKHFEMRGTEHDEYRFVDFEDLTKMESQCVPGLIQAFHHATYGKFNNEISSDVRQWSRDKENGASIMTQNAIRLVNNDDNSNNRISTARHIAMLRPSMVPIVNVMNRIINENGREVVTMQSFLREMDLCVKMAQHAIENLMMQKSKKDMGSNGSSDGGDNDKPNLLTIATFSRSGTIRKILEPFVKDNSCNVICSQSTPGDEGELMAKDLKTNWISDEDMHELLNDKKAGDSDNLGASIEKEESPVVDIVLIGSDCILPLSMVNKVGTKQLCKIAQRNNIPVFCCADTWKVWDDIYPPPIETDLFEFVPLDLVTKLLVPDQNNIN